MMDIIHGIDFGILDFLQTLHNGVLDFIMRIFTHAGDNGYIWIAVTVVLLCIPKTRKIGIYLGVTLILEVVLNELIIKEIIQRERPFLQRTGIDTIINQPSSYSFPSGHTASSFAAATAIYQHSKKWGIAAYVLASVIAFSRLYFYVHFPTDILAGTILGIAVGIGVNRLLAMIEKKIINKKAANK